MRRDQSWRVDAHCQRIAGTCERDAQRGTSQLALWRQREDGGMLFFFSNLRRHGVLSLHERDGQAMSWATRGRVGQRPLSSLTMANQTHRAGVGGCSVCPRVCTFAADCVCCVIEMIVRSRLLHRRAPQPRARGGGRRHRLRFAHLGRYR
jgi:hypothetical protein